MSWVVPVVAGFFIWNGFYLSLRGGLTRIIFDPLYKRFYKPSPRSASSDEVLRKYGISKSPSPETRLPDVDVVEISERILEFTFNAIVTVSSLLIMWQAHTDVLTARSSALIPFSHFAAQYFFHDFRAKYFTVIAKAGLNHSSYRKKFSRFFKKQGLFVIHHILIICLGYPLAIDCFNWRGGIGDFVVGAFFTHDIGDCFLVINQILRVFNYHLTVFALVSGVIGIIIFFTTRVIKWPLVLLFYSAQYHDYSFSATAVTLYPACWLGMFIDCAFSTYWFYRIVTVALQSIKKAKSD